jgi:hypothetical protein
MQKLYPTRPLLNVPERSKDARPASKIVEQLIKEKKGYLEERENILLEEYLSGNIPHFLRTMQPVPFKNNGSTVVVYCLPDYLCLGSDDDFVHTPMSPVLAQKIADAWGLQMPTIDMVDAVRRESQVKLDFRAMTPTGGFPRDESMMYTERWPIHTAWFKTDMVAHTGRLGQLVSGHKKDLVVHPWLLKDRFHHCGIHGAYFGNDIPIHNFEYNQTAHELMYKDYSHGARLFWPMVYVTNEGGAAEAGYTIAERVMSEEYKPLSQQRFVAEPRYPV